MILKVINGSFDWLSWNDWYSFFFAALVDFVDLAAGRFLAVVAVDFFVDFVAMVSPV